MVKKRDLRKLIEKKDKALAEAESAYTGLKAKAEKAEDQLEHSQRQVHAEVRKGEDRVRTVNRIADDRVNAIKRDTERRVKREIEMRESAERRTAEAEEQLKAALGRIDDFVDVVKGIRAWLQSTDIDLQEVFDEAVTTVTELVGTE